MLEGDVVLPPGKDSYDCIRGYTSNVECCICHCDVLVKSGTVQKDSPCSSGSGVMWTLCHVCHDKGWQIPLISEDYQNLVYLNLKTGEIVEHKILFID